MTQAIARYALTLTEAVEAIADGQLTARSLAEAQLARIAGTEAAIAAWAMLDPGHVRKAADRCDAAARNLPLAGVGIGIKDIIATAELPTEMGSPIFAGHRPARDAACIERLKAAGAYVFGKTVTTPFAFMDPGKTRNPWDPAHTPGGSSSGSAAAVAAGHVAGALGTQTNGSVIRPAAYCGIVGFKPTLNTIPFAGTHQFSETLDTIGTFARTVEDAALLASAVTDRGRLAGAITPLAKPPRLAYLSAFPWTQLDCDADDVVEAAVTQLRTRAEVVAVEFPPGFRDANVVFRVIMLHEAARHLGEMQARERARFSPQLNEALDEGRKVSDGAYELALAARERAIVDFTEWIDGFDAVLTPSAPGPAPWSLATTGDPSCCTLWSFTGFPAISIPVGRAPALPIGLQLAAPQGRDDHLLSVAAWCEARLPFRGLV